MLLAPTPLDQKLVEGEQVRFRPEERSTKLPQTGGCQCRQICYEIAQEPQLVYTCHCLDCQRLTSSAFSLGAVVPEMEFRLTGVEPRQLQRSGDSGRVNTRVVCAESGSWVCGMPRDGVIHVKGGTLDDMSWLRPTKHIWVRRKQPWVKFPRAMNSSKDSLRDRAVSFLASLRSPTQR